MTSHFIVEGMRVPMDTLIHDVETVYRLRPSHPVSYWRPRQFLTMRDAVDGVRAWLTFMQPYTATTYVRPWLLAPALGGARREFGCLAIKVKSDGSLWRGAVPITFTCD